MVMREHGGRRDGEAAREQHVTGAQELGATRHLSLFDAGSVAGLPSESVPCAHPRTL
jgi:hypothetical protein